MRALGGPHGHVGGEGKAQGEGDDGLGDRLGHSEDLRALGDPMGMWVVRARPRMRVVMDLGIELDLLQI